jgi:hypothetical protein
MNTTKCKGLGMMDIHSKLSVLSGSEEFPCFLPGGMGWNENQLAGHQHNQACNYYHKTQSKINTKRPNLHKSGIKIFGRNSVAPNCLAVKARNGMSAELTQKCKLQNQS